MSGNPRRMTVKDTVRQVDVEKYWPQVLAILVGSLGTLNNGLTYSWCSPYIVKITQDKVNYDITEDEASYFPVIPPISMCVFCPLFTYLSGVIGPKKTFLLATVPYLANWILSAVAKEVYVFYIARILVGMTDSAMFSAFPMYVGEISVPKVRGTFGNVPTLAIYLGELIINIIGVYFSATQASYICIVIPVLFGLLFSLMPESPYFLLIKGREQDAKQALIWLRRKKDIEADFEQLKTDVKRQMSERGYWRELVTVMPNRKALLAGVFLRFSQQLSGLQPFAVYTKYIFEKSGSNLNTNTSTIVYSAVTMVLFTIAGFTSDYLGRKKAYMISLAAASVVLWLTGAYFSIAHFKPQVDLSMFQWVPLAGLVGHTVFASFGIAIIPTLMLGELFSSSIKAKGLMILVFVLGFGTTGVVYLFYFLTSTFGMFCPFVLFAACTSLSAILTYCAVPETTGLTLEEIQQSFAKKATINK